jgi:hypothetical protein
VYTSNKKPRLHRATGVGFALAIEEADAFGFVV